MAEEAKTFLAVHLPYRLQAIHGLGIACELLLLANQPQQVRILFDDVTVFEAASHRDITNAMLESGLNHCRGLLAFLGIALDHRAGRLVTAAERTKATDITMSTLGLKPITLAELRRAPGRGGDDTEAACATAMIMAHKGVVHMTTAKRPANSYESCLAASEIVTWAVREFVYGQLRMPFPGEESIAPGAD